MMNTIEPAFSQDFDFKSRIIFCSLSHLNDILQLFYMPIAGLTGLSNQSSNNQSRPKAVSIRAATSATVPLASMR